MTLYKKGLFWALCIGSILNGYWSFYRVDQLTFYTNMRIFGPFGENGGSGPYAVNGDYLMYFSGRAGRKIDEITFYFNQCD